MASEYNTDPGQGYKIPRKKKVRRRAQPPPPPAGMPYRVPEVKGPPAPGHKRPGPFPSTTQPTFTGFKKGEHRKIRRFKKTKAYKRAYKAAQRARVRAERRGAALRRQAYILEAQRKAAEEHAQARSRDQSGYARGLTDLTPTKRVVPKVLRETPKTAKTIDILGGKDLETFARPRAEAKQKVFEAAARLPDDPRAPVFPLKKYYSPKERKTITRRTEKFVRQVGQPKKRGGKKAYKRAKLRTPEAAVSLAAYELSKLDPHDLANALAGRTGSIHGGAKKSGGGVRVAGVDIDLSPSHALDLLMRPVYASAGAAEALRSGHPEDVPKAAYRGARGLERLTYSDVLKRGGAPPAVATIGGLAGDVVLGPLPGWGVVSPASKAAKAARALTKAKYARAAEAAERRVQFEVATRVARKGAAGSERRREAIEREVRARLENAPRKPGKQHGKSVVSLGDKAAERAAKRAYERDPAKNRGVQLTFGRKTVKGGGQKRKVRRGTSGRASAAVLRKVGGPQAAESIRGLRWSQAAGKAFHAGFRPEGQSAEAHAAKRASELEARHTLDMQLSRVDERVRVYDKALSENDPSALLVNDALEGFTSKRVARSYLARDKEGLYDVPDATRTRLERFVDDKTRDYTRFGFKDLPTHVDPSKNLRNIAKNLEEDFKHLRRVQAEAGVGGKRLKVEDRSLGEKGRPAEARGYLKHVRRQDVEALEGTSRKVRRMKRAPGTGSAREGVRTMREPLAVQREEIPHLFEERTPVLFAVAAQKTYKQAAAGTHLRNVAEGGRDLRPRWNARGEMTHSPQWDSTTEALYHAGPQKGKGGRFGVRKLEQDDQLGAQELNRLFTSPAQRIAFKNRAKQLHARAAKTDNPAEAEKLLKEAKKLEELAQPPEPGRYFIGDRGVVDDVLEAGVGRAPEDLVGEWNKVMALWKKAVTLPMPSYHLRNLYGDFWNAHLESSVSDLFRALGDNKGLLKEYNAFKKSRVSLDRAARSEKLSPEVEFMVRAEELGVIGAGFSRDVIEQLGRRTPSRLERASQWRENLLRLASFRSAVKRGVPFEEAARVVKRVHFDYGDLTEFERGVRAVIPFYTFAAKNTALQASKFVTWPNKYATFEKVRVEGMKAAGMPTDWQDRVPDYVKLQLPIPAFGATSDGLPMLAVPGLPITDLNRLNPDQALGMLLQSLGPWRAAFESYLNTSVYFRDQIDRGRPVAAPDWVGTLPGPLRSMLQIEKSDRPDAKTGETGYWVWPAKTDFMMKQLPEVNYLLQLTTSQKNRRGQGAFEKAISLTGVRPQPYDEAQNKINQLFNKREDLEQELLRLPNLEQIPSKKLDYTPAERRRLTKERTQVNRKISRIDHRLYEVSKRAKYKFPYGTAPTPLTLDERIDKRLQGGSDVDDLIERRLEGPEDVDDLIEKRLGR